MSVQSAARELGLLERYSLTRSLIGDQALPVVGFSLALPLDFSAASLRARVLSAAAVAARYMPSAYARCVNAKSATPGLALVDSFDVADMLIWDESSLNVDQAIERLFDVDLEVETSSLPVWRICVWHRPGSSEAWIGLGTGHMVFDGLAAADFAKSIIGQIVSGKDLLEGGQVQRPGDLGSLPGSLESLIRTAPSMWALTTVIFNELLLPKLPTIISSRFPKPVTWTGSPERSASAARIVTNVTFDASLVRRLDKASRQHSVTLHSFLHAALVKAIAPLADSPRERLLSSTPISLRRWLPEQPVQGNYSGGLIYNSTPEEDLWAHARSYHAWLKHTDRRSDALQAIGMLAYIPSGADKASSEGWETFFNAKNAQPREQSFSLNNLGRVKVPQGNGGWQVTSVTFSERPLPTHPPLIFAFATLEAGSTPGPMTLSLTREAHAVSEEDVAVVLTRLQDVFRQIGTE